MISRISPSTNRASVPGTPAGSRSFPMLGVNVRSWLISFSPSAWTTRRLPAADPGRRRASAARNRFARLRSGRPNRSGLSGAAGSAGRATRRARHACSCSTLLLRCTAGLAVADREALLDIGELLALALAADKAADELRKRFAPMTFWHLA